MFPELKELLVVAGGIIAFVMAGLAALKMIAPNIKGLVAVLASAFLAVAFSVYAGQAMTPKLAPFAIAILALVTFIMANGGYALLGRMGGQGITPLPPTPPAAPQG
jgi:hypothetical protein